MAIYLEQPYYFSTDKQQDDFLIDDINSLVSTQSTFIEQSKDFVAYMRQQLFNTTSTAFPIPDSLFMQKVAHGSNQYSRNPFQYPSDPFDSSDALSYRRQRSENLLLRMICCKRLNLNQISIMRLSRGVFVHQVWQPSSPQSSPTLSTIDDILSQTIDSNVNEAPVDNFHFDTLYSKRGYDYDGLFVPYSYTFGARYTNPYSDVHDLIIRGRLPVWCQTLFLLNCLKQSIQPNVPYTGLFPFAPQVTVTFTSLGDYHMVIPEMTLLYERFTMEHMDPYAFPDVCNGEDEQSVDWPKHKQQILSNILICDIPDDVSKLLEHAANMWAVNQGLML
ncbi:hypothetical protein G6F70_001207 [Rhizopus microsporus]|uniref:Uncharacterized protein n=2 Tax=Rhizopus TaxID=4842 RepID=A0A367JHV3_RHIAZ|nr:hypothetical protein G6F71_005872 [Rhizopus microsporus]RCH89449.1 hypothetical protein CU097_009158 [Rhizopus azygosporus]KAG1203617.1 hypothetical protein G6F70_001207 [Rhizopus microsporus]KAG1213939.1 hypothetical protein G6F69_002386 [Rhizopus microsporus]KAG1231619.1 hypothetical protein G6F67_005619 [Rhizopus microsporus]